MIQLGVILLSLILLSLALIYSRLCQLSVDVRWHAQGGRGRRTEVWGSLLGAALALVAILALLLASGVAPVLNP